MIFKFLGLPVCILGPGTVLSFLETCRKAFSPLSTLGEVLKKNTQLAESELIANLRQGRGELWPGYLDQGGLGQNH
jgi:hypothetical protein